MSSYPKASSVVAQRKPPLPSSAYEVRSVVRCDAPLPRVAALSVQKGEAGGVRGYIIEGAAGPERADASRWSELPHRVFANLPAADTGLIEPKAALAFIEKHGVMLSRLWLPGFRVDSGDLSEAQGLLRAAWRGDADAVARLQTVGVEDRSIIQRPVAGLSLSLAAKRLAAGEAKAETQPDVEAEVLSKGVELTARDVWSFICVLFLRDRAAGRLGVCECPECVAPFFLRKRRTQKYCEAGPCAAWAARRRALGWWRRNRGKRRAKKRAKARRR